MFPIELLGVKTYPAKSARNPGVIFDKNFKFRSHISAICSSCIYHIRDLRRIRHHLDLDSAKLLANALVSSHLDYCNSVLSVIAETDLTKLQRVLNSLARVVTKSPPFTRSVPVLRSLHWLPVKYRVHFKICLLTYKALHEEQPVYLRSLIAISPPSRSLRSNRRITLSIPRIKINTGARAFSSCAPSLWNNLSLSVRSATSVVTFRRRLKPYLFDLGSPPVDTGVPYSLLMLRNDSNDFAFEHRSGCCATEPGYAGDIGAIEIWLIDWLIDYMLTVTLKFNWAGFIEHSERYSHKQHKPIMGVTRVWLPCQLHEMVYLLTFCITFVCQLRCRHCIPQLCQFVEKKVFCHFHEGSTLR